MQQIGREKREPSSLGASFEKGQSEGREYFRIIQNDTEGLNLITTHNREEAKTSGIKKIHEFVVKNKKIDNFPQSNEKNNLINKLKTISIDYPSVTKLSNSDNIWFKNLRIKYQLFWNSIVSFIINGGKTDAKLTKEVRQEAYYQELGMNLDRIIDEKIIEFGEDSLLSDFFDNSGQAHSLKELLLARIKIKNIKNDGLLKNSSIIQEKLKAFFNTENDDFDTIRNKADEFLNDLDNRRKSEQPSEKIDAKRQFSRDRSEFLLELRYFIDGSVADDADYRWQRSG